MSVFGLIGKKLGHSFSQRYFTEKFRREGLPHHYDLFEFPEISGVANLLRRDDIRGLNVTIPYKEKVIPYLDGLDETASRIGAVNVIRFSGEKRIGYNSDYAGFRRSLESWLGDSFRGKALVLGTGGASKAVKTALLDMDIEHRLVSRQPEGDQLRYDQITPELMAEYLLIINTTPLGMFPDVNLKPAIPYNAVSGQHFLYDLVYNPEDTAFMKYGRAGGAKVKNGLEMLYLQAERAWEIWNE